uniref:HMG box domain-containing protein n=1 Tax=Timema monikensis TaxID=170555 RepID=A0A7R9HN12_9NEOP|nr:unnamed protein product [Timema monikensis]
MESNTPCEPLNLVKHKTKPVAVVAPSAVLEAPPTFPEPCQGRLLKIPKAFSSVDSAKIGDPLRPDGLYSMIHSLVACEHKFLTTLYVNGLMNGSSRPPLGFPLIPGYSGSFLSDVYRGQFGVAPVLGNLLTFADTQRQLWQMVGSPENQLQSSAAQIPCASTSTDTELPLGKKSRGKRSSSMDQKNSTSSTTEGSKNQDSGQTGNNQDKKKPHIKKPLNAFMLYMKEMRAKVVAECTLKESAAINQILGRRPKRHSTLKTSAGALRLHYTLVFKINIHTRTNKVYNGKNQGCPFENGHEWSGEKTEVQERRQEFTLNSGAGTFLFGEGGTLTVNLQSHNKLTGFGKSGSSLSCSLDGHGMIGSCSFEGPETVSSCSLDGSGMVSSCSIDSPWMVGSCSLEGSGTISSCSLEGSCLTALDGVKALGWYAYNRHRHLLTTILSLAEKMLLMLVATQSKVELVLVINVSIWHSLTREEQAKYYEKARQERQLHMQLYPGWSARDNYGYGAKKKKRKKERSTSDTGGTNISWHALGREEQAKYYELARRERQLHMQLYPDWSSRANSSRGKKRKRKQETNDGGCVMVCCREQHEEMSSQVWTGPAESVVQTLQPIFPDKHLHTVPSSTNSIINKGYELDMPDKLGIERTKYHPQSEKLDALSKYSITECVEIQTVLLVEDADPQTSVILEDADPQTDFLVIYADPQKAPMMKYSDLQTAMIEDADLQTVSPSPGKSRSTGRPKKDCKRKMIHQSRESRKTFCQTKST